jgi:zinc protease
MPFPFRATVLAAALATLLPAAAAIDLNARVPVGPQVKVGKLANGLTYYIRQNAKPEHRVELRLVVKAGSVLEDDDQQGLAHMVEHLAFNGSTHFKKQELVSYLQSIGVKFGADLNAYTSLDETVYMLPVPTDRKENVEKAFTVLEDWAHGVTLNADDIDKERAIVLEEARLRKGAPQRMQQALMPKLFNGSRYALREPIGKEDVIRTAQPEALRRFYRDWYRPDLMAVVVVGDIAPAEAERLVKAHFAGLKNPSTERARTWADIAPRAATEAFVFADDEMPINTVTLHYPVRLEPESGTYAGYRDKTVQALFAIMLNQRFAELAQQGNAPWLFAGGRRQSAQSPPQGLYGDRRPGCRRPGPGAQGAARGRTAAGAPVRFHGGGAGTCAQDLAEQDGRVLQGAQHHRFGRLCRRIHPQFPDRRNHAWASRPSSAWSRSCCRPSAWTTSTRPHARHSRRTPAG